MPVLDTLVVTIGPIRERRLDREAGCNGQHDVDLVQLTSIDEHLYGISGK